MNGSGGKLDRIGAAYSFLDGQFVTGDIADRIRGRRITAKREVRQEGIIANGQVARYAAALIGYCHAVAANARPVDLVHFAVIADI